MKNTNRFCLYIAGITIIMTWLAPAWGASIKNPEITSASIKEKKLKRGTKIEILKSDLIDNRYAVITGSAIGGETSVAKVEVSLDNGNTWMEATGQEKWQSQFTPVPNYTYFLKFRVTNANGAVSSPSQFGTIHLTYLPITLNELIQHQADVLAKAYMSKRLEKYMNLISKDYQNYPRGIHKLRKAIQNDFRTRNNIVLRFTVNQVFKLDKVIIAQIHWTLMHSRLNEPREGDIEIHFDTTNQLKILVQKKDLYFEETIVGHNGRIQVRRGSGTIKEVIVTDLDLLGAGSINVRAWGNCDPIVPFTANMRLTETPPNSGRFRGMRDCYFSNTSNYFSAAYTDKITSDWRRNIRRTSRLDSP
jgi:hypothetical protein